MRHDDKDEGVQEQTRGRGQTVSGCDPVSRDGSGQLEGGWVRHDEEHGKGHELLLNVHLVLLSKKFKTLRTLGRVSLLGPRACY